MTSLSESYIAARRRQMARPRSHRLEAVGRGFQLLIAFGLVWIAGMCAIAAVTRDPALVLFAGVFLVFAAGIAWAER